MALRLPEAEARVRGQGKEDQPGAGREGRQTADAAAVAEVSESGLPGRKMRARGSEPASHSLSSNDRIQQVFSRNSQPSKRSLTCRIFSEFTVPARFSFALPSQILLDCLRVPAQDRQRLFAVGARCAGAGAGAGDPGSLYQPPQQHLHQQSRARSRNPVREANGGKAEAATGVNSADQTAAACFGSCHSCAAAADEGSTAAPVGAGAAGFQRRYKSEPPCECAAGGAAAAAAAAASRRGWRRRKERRDVERHCHRPEGRAAKRRRRRVGWTATTYV